MGPPFAGGAPCGPPASCAPPSCGPQQCCNNTWELGARAIYLNNGYKWQFSDSRQNIDFVRDLNFSPSYFTGEVYGAIRFAPCFALTYTFVIPYADGGWGVLPSRIRFDGVTVPAGATTNWKTTPYLLRQEAEYYLFTGCNFRVGAVLAGQVLVQETKLDFIDNTQVVAAPVAQHLKDTFVWGVPGVGGIAEFSPINLAFFRFKGIYHIIPNRAWGYTLDGDARFFPEFGAGSCGGPPMCKLYLGAGYRYTNIEVHESENADFNIFQHGPYGEIGLIF